MIRRTAANKLTAIRPRLTWRIRLYQKARNLFKKNLHFLLLLLAALLLKTELATAEILAPPNCPVQAFDKGLLWQVQKPGIRPSYIFGTMHSRDKRILHIPGAVMSRFMTAGTAVFETTLDDRSLAQSRQVMKLPPGQSLKNLVGLQKFMQLAKLVSQKNIAPAVLNRLKIWAVATILAQPDPPAQKNARVKLLDKELESAARQWKKKIIALETNLEQIAVFDSMPQAVQMEFLDQSLAEIGTLEMDMETMTQFYLKGQTGWIWCDLQESLTHSSRKLRTVLNEHLILDRNAKMVQRLQKILPAGNVFVAIGALHLPGEQGVVNLLKRSGYEISRKY